MSAKFYIVDDILYYGELSDIETYIALTRGYCDDLKEAKPLVITHTAVVALAKLKQEIDTKREEVKNLLSTFNQGLALKTLEK